MIRPLTGYSTVQPKKSSSVNITNTRYQPHFGAVLTKESDDVLRLIEQSEHFAKCKFTIDNFYSCLENVFKGVTDDMPDGVAQLHVEKGSLGITYVDKGECVPSINFFSADELFSPKKIPSVRVLCTTIAKNYNDMLKLANLPLENTFSKKQF